MCTYTCSYMAHARLIGSLLPRHTPGARHTCLYLTNPRFRPLTSSWSSLFGDGFSSAAICLDRPAADTRIKKAKQRGEIEEKKPTSRFGSLRVDRHSRNIPPPSRPSPPATGVGCCYSLRLQATFSQENPLPQRLQPCCLVRLLFLPRTRQATFS